MNEQYVSYAQSVALRECGFDMKQWHGASYIEKIPGTERDVWDDEECQWSTIYDMNRYPKLRLDQAQKWLREEKKIDVLVWCCACGYGWDLSKAGNEQTRGTTLLEYDYNGEDENSGMWLTYEAALSAGIGAALGLIRQK